MFRKLYRLCAANPLDKQLKKARKKKIKRVILGWNRGLGDIALGLYAIVERIRFYLPACEIIFIVRKDLFEGFLLLKEVTVIKALHWERGKDSDFLQTLKLLDILVDATTLLIPKPDPTYWVKWQRGKVIPKLIWQKQWDLLWKNFLTKDPAYTYVAVQPSGETNYNTWRNWPYENWKAFFQAIDDSNKKIKIILFGHSNHPVYDYHCVMDLRGKTNVFAIFSIIKNCCQYAVLPDSGLLSILYYLQEIFPIRVISLWANPYHGILKQNVPSPNHYLEHFPIISPIKNDLSLIDPGRVLQLIENAAD